MSFYHEVLRRSHEILIKCLSPVPGNHQALKSCLLKTKFAAQEIAGNLSEVNIRAHGINDLMKLVMAYKLVFPEVFQQEERKK